MTDSERVEELEQRLRAYADQVETLRRERDEIAQLTADTIAIWAENWQEQKERAEAAERDRDEALKRVEELLEEGRRIERWRPT